MFLKFSKALASFLLLIKLLFLNTYVLKVYGFLNSFVSLIFVYAVNSLISS